MVIFSILKSMGQKKLSLFEFFVDPIQRYGHLVKIMSMGQFQNVIWLKNYEINHNWACLHVFMLYHTSLFAYFYQFLSKKLFSASSKFWHVQGTAVPLSTESSESPFPLDLDPLNPVQTHRHPSIPAKTCPDQLKPVQTIGQYMWMGFNGLDGFQGVWTCLSWSS